MSATETEEFLDIGDVDDFPVRSVTLVEHEGHKVGVVRWDDDRFYALLNRCPHMGGPLCMGHVGPAVAGSVPGAADLVDKDQPVIACPWHRWEFDPATGAALVDPSMRVRTYPVRVEGDRVLVGRRANRRRA